MDIGQLITSLIGRRRREKDPVKKARLQLLVEQLQTKLSGDAGPDIEMFIKRQIGIVAVL